MTAYYPARTATVTADAEAVEQPIIGAVDSGALFEGFVPREGYASALLAIRRSAGDGEVSLKLHDDDEDTPFVLPTDADAYRELGPLDGAGLRQVVLSVGISTSVVVSILPAGAWDIPERPEPDPE